MLTFCILHSVYRRLAVSPSPLTFCMLHSAVSPCSHSVFDILHSAVSPSPHAHLLHSAFCVPPSRRLAVSPHILYAAFCILPFPSLPYDTICHLLSHVASRTGTGGVPGGHTGRVTTGDTSRESFSEESLERYLETPSRESLVGYLLVREGREVSRSGAAAVPPGPFAVSPLPSPSRTVGPRTLCVLRLVARRPFTPPLCPCATLELSTANGALWVRTTLNDPERPTAPHGCRLYERPLGATSDRPPPALSLSKRPPPALSLSKGPPPALSLPKGRLPMLTYCMLHSAFGRSPPALSLSKGPPPALSLPKGHLPMLTFCMLHSAYCRPPSPEARRAATRDRCGLS